MTSSYLYPEFEKDIGLPPEITTHKCLDYALPSVHVYIQYMCPTYMALAFLEFLKPHNVLSLSLATIPHVSSYALYIYISAASYKHHKAKLFVTSVHHFH